MGVISFTQDQELAAAFVRLAEELYRGDGGWIPPFREQKINELVSKDGIVRQPGADVRHFLARSGGRILGRISAFINPELCDADGHPVGTVGNFECIDDRNVSNDLFASACGWIRETSGSATVWGPMNYDIWHGYRLMTRGFDRKPFCSEPYNLPYYPALFEHAGFRVLQTWNSVELNGREEIEHALRRGRTRHQSVLAKGYSFHPFDMRRYSNDLLNLYELLNRSFRCFLGYTPTRFAEFKRIFGPNRAALDPALFVFARDARHQLCGLAGSFMDVSEGVRAMRGNVSRSCQLRFLVRRSLCRRAIFYLGGITPEEAEKHAGLGRAAFYHVLHQALQRGYTSIVVALMAHGNVVRGVLNGRGAYAEREYALYQRTAA